MIKNLGIKQLTDASLIEVHKNNSGEYPQWEIERELYERAFNPNPVYAINATASDTTSLGVTSSNTVASGSTTVASSTYYTDPYHYNWEATPLYGYVSTLNVVTYFTIHAKINNITYQVGLQEFATHSQARAKILHVLEEANRVELVTFRGSFNEYDYPKVEDVDRFYIRQQTKQIETNPYQWYDITYCDTTTTNTSETIK